MVTKILYALFSAWLVISGAVRGDMYRLVMGIGTYFLYPLFWAIYKIFRWKPGYQLEFCVYVCTFLAYPLGGTAEFYQKIQGFDKVAHTLSGVFVAMLALTLFLYLERKRPLREHSVPTAVLFVFFASMAVAGLFELCEMCIRDSYKALQASGMAVMNYGTILVSLAAVSYTHLGIVIKFSG